MMRRLRLIQHCLVFTVICLAVLLVFGRIVNHEFLTWDDDLHVTRNPYLQAPWAQTLVRFWREPYCGLYIPAAYTLFAGEARLSRLWNGLPLDPRVFHATSLVLHLGCAWLTYRLLHTWTERPAPAALGALLFCVHPLQVESVAWVSETRGLLAALGSLFAISAYYRAYPTLVRSHADPALHANIAERSSWRCVVWQSAALAAWGIALLSKPSAVVVPVLIALIEFGCFRVSWRQIAERLWFWLLPAIGVSFLTGAEQREDLLLERTSMLVRPLIAGDALSWYAAKLAIPIGLCADYGRSPSAVMASGWRYAGLFVACASAFMASFLPRRRLWLTCWGIWLIGLLPVLGLVPFAYQYYSTVADRYAYLSMLGPALALALGLPDFHPDSRSRGILWSGTAVFILAWGCLSWRQAETWRNDEALYGRMLAINPQSFVAWNNLGSRRALAGKTDEAITLFQKSLQIRPDFALAHRHLGLAYMQLGRREEALAELQQAVRLAPYDGLAHYDLGVILVDMGRGQEAEREFGAAIRINPVFAEAHNNLGNLYQQQGDHLLAARHYRRALAISPTFATARVNLGHVLLIMGRQTEAANEYQTALLHDSRLPEARHNLGILAAQAGHLQEAAKHLEAAHQLAPDKADTLWYLATVREEMGDQPGAIAAYENFLRHRPDNVPALANLARIRRSEGHVDDAVRLLERALTCVPEDSQEARDIRERLQEAREKRSASQDPL
jgi:tetratricopeptide (TPR) repeat protein